jgi:hypothetical protein
LVSVKFKKYDSTVFLLTWIIISHTRLGFEYMGHLRWKNRSQGTTIVLTVKV